MSTIHLYSVKSAVLSRTSKSLYPNVSDLSMKFRLRILSTSSSPAEFFSRGSQFSPQRARLIIG